MKNFIRITCIISFLILGSCSKSNPLSDNCLSGSWLENVERELTAWSVATSAYGENPTKENCENQKKAGLAYINALDEVASCVPTVSSAEFKEAKKEAQDEIKATVCD